MMNTWLILAFALPAVLLVLRRTLRIRSGGQISPVAAGDADNDYAEEYTRTERLRFVTLGLGLGLPVMAATQWWALPALRDFAETAHCDNFYGINGTTLLMHGVFVGLPILAALVIGVPCAWRGGRIIRDQQNPPRGQKVFKRTKIRRGWRARLAGYLHYLPLLLFVGLAVWGEGAARTILAGSDAAAEEGPDTHPCPVETRPKEDE